MARRKQKSQAKLEDLKFMPMPNCETMPEGEKLAYRRELQEIVLTVTNQFIAENREEIMRRAHERIKTIKMLSR